jgi:ubiquinone/menaquinone biosynthesis C-methylase UbiE
MIEDRPLHSKKAGAIKTRRLAGWQFYDEHVEVCDVVRGREPETLDPDDRKVAEWFIQALRGCRRVIDVGCGPGFPGLYVATHVDEIVGIDAAPNVVRVAQEHAARLGVSNVLFETGNADQIRFDDGAFDGAMACGVFESMDWQQARRVLPQIWRVLRDNGRLVVLDQDWELVLRRRPYRQSMIQVTGERLILRSVERIQSPPTQLDKRYVIVPESPTGQRLLAELGGKKRVATALFGEDLALEDVEELVYEETAQFDGATLTAFIASTGFRDVNVERLEVWDPYPLVLTATK